MARVDAYFGTGDDKWLRATQTRRGIYVAQIEPPIAYSDNQNREITFQDCGNVGPIDPVTKEVNCSLSGTHNDYGEFYYRISFDSDNETWLHAWAGINGVEVKSMMNKWLQIPAGTYLININGGKYPSPDSAATKDFYITFGDAAISINVWQTHFLKPFTRN